ncbi:MgtC/SapB family protein [Clostridium oryzae]|uniref:Putative Mg(2+) transport ATPase n=1 Tax=Clostridium oryzae TaxID=1450648 RepID=A0A1V4IZN1_9CLOT|nr:MgtC/SapB family protein [Clostridium oryzae]OPJ64877.1 putative Mg(2+) transport ATPase [Clostridium oryzae]
MKLSDVIIRLILAVVVGGLIGLEREKNNRTAGFRTHILVTVGAAIISMIQINIIADVQNSVAGDKAAAQLFKVDYGRLPAQVISGIGFLGAGTIIRDKGSIKGLTTAASIWVVACIGIAIGFGYYELSIASLVCLYLALVFLKNFEKKYIDKTREFTCSITFSDNKMALVELEKYTRENGIRIKHIEYPEENDDEEELELTYTFIVPKDKRGSELAAQLKNVQYIKEIRVE